MRAIKAAQARAQILGARGEKECEEGDSAQHQDHVSEASCDVSNLALRVGELEERFFHLEACLTEVIFGSKAGSPQLKAGIAHNAHEGSGEEGGRPGERPLESEGHSPSKAGAAVAHQKMQEQRLCVSQLHERMACLEVEMAPALRNLTDLENQVCNVADGVASLQKFREEVNCTLWFDTDCAAEGAAKGDAARYRFLPRGMLRTEPGFTVLSMNILAGHLGRSSTHGFCKEGNLFWENRRRKLLDGFRRARPDVLLLQEVQGTGVTCKDNHFEVLSADLEEVGYTVGAYARLCGPDGEEDGINGRNSKKAHPGNAVFFHTDTWERLGHGRIAFAHLLTDQCGANAAQRRHYTEGRQSAAWARMRHRATGQAVVAVSVHISGNFRNPDKQVAQVHSMLHHLETAVLRPNEALVIGGDFNSQPGSGVYELLSSGVLRPEHVDALPCPQAAAAGVPQLCGPEGFRTGLHLASAYSALNGSEPRLTTKSPCFSGTVDYIWYSLGTVVPEQGTALSMPTDLEAGTECGGLPNTEVPSDHVPLGLAFTFPS